MPSRSGGWPATTASKNSSTTRRETGRTSVRISSSLRPAYSHLSLIVVPQPLDEGVDVGQDPLGHHRRRAPGAPRSSHGAHPASDWYSAPFRSRGTAGKAV